MAKKNRKTLKHYFRNGAMPTEENFVDLIDSTLNIRDEGFDRSLEHGIKISVLGGSEKLMSFFNTIDSQDAQWTVELKDKNKLILVRNSLEDPDNTKDSEDNGLSPENNDFPKEMVTITHDGKIGVKEKKPKTTLDINGTLKSSGRTGLSGSKEAPADGKWHRIIENLNGCNAFEIMAGAGKEGTGKYGLMHAFAVNAFNDKKKIKYHQAYFFWKCNKIKLRWTGTRNNYHLEIKTRSDFGDDVVIKYNTTMLWFDPLMKECIKK